MKDPARRREGERSALVSRRRFVGGLLGLGGGVLLDPRSSRALEALPTAFPAPEGEPVGRIPFELEPDAPFGKLIGGGLDARLYTDHAQVTSERPLTPPEEFFVRTGVPGRLDASRPWSVRLDGLVGNVLNREAAWLAESSRDQGVHVMECAGNSRWVRFALLSAAAWQGVPLARLLDEAGVLPQAAAVRVSGFDSHSTGSTNSAPGCSWVFGIEDLLSGGAFLATAMSGLRLSPDHGHPVRLMVPGWYGCSCVKWVERLEVVDGEQPATSQMIEFAGRTHQDGIPKRAADYRPATVDLAAMPTRVEAWRVGERIRYRVTGLSWGGGETDRLAIRFSPTEAFQRVTRQPKRAVGGSWGLWSHDWEPESGGRYLIQLRVEDPAVRTRRLDSGYYVRAVEIPAVRIP